MKQALSNLGLIGNILLLFLASLAPLMFLVSVIAAVDAINIHNRLMDALAQGQDVPATVVSVEREINYIGYRLTEANGEEVYAGMISRIYPAEIWDRIKPGQVINIRYLGEQVPGYYATGVPLEVYKGWQSHWGIPADVLWLMFGAWMVVVFKPHFVFLGTMPFDDLFKPAKPK